MFGPKSESDEDDEPIRLTELQKNRRMKLSEASIALKGASQKEDPEVLTLGTQADGCYYSSPSYDAANPGPTGRKFVDAFQKKYSRLPNVHQANHYDLVLLYSAVADGLAKQNKALTGASFRDYLSATMPQYQGAAGAYKFNFKDGSVLRSSIVKVVRDGKFTKLDDLS